MRLHMKKLGSPLLAVALLAAACSGSDDSDTATESDEGIENTAGGLDTGGVDQSDDSGAEMPAAASTTTMAAEAEMADQAADGEARLAADSPAAEGSGGFFGTSPNKTEETDGSEEDNTFQDYGIRPFVDVARDPLSTFALDVDTASYSVAERWVEGGAVPPPESVRVEEFVNSFNYDYPAPRDGLTVVADAGPSPFNSDNVIVRLGVQAEQVANADRPNASLTFVVDTSGSMDRGDRLGLVKTALQRLVVELGREDTVAIVTYSDNAQVLLPPTSVADESVILECDRQPPDRRFHKPRGRSAARLRPGQRVLRQWRHQPSRPCIGRSGQRRPHRSRGARLADPR